MKQFFIICLMSILFVTNAFSDESFSMYSHKKGNSEILTRSDLKKMLALKDALRHHSPDDLHKAYFQNSLRYEKDYGNHVITITGKVSRVRTSILGEYIVELKCSENWLSDFCVVYPKQITDLMKKELADLVEDDYFEAVVICRTEYGYADIPVWEDQNGFYRTEP